MSSQPNVFVLSIDSLPYSSFNDSSREIASLINGVNFTEAIAPASFTSSAMPGLATGTYTDEIPAWGLPESGEPVPIAEALAAEGYEGSLWTDNYLFGAEYNYDRGFSAGNLGRPSWKKRLANQIKESPLSPAFGVFESIYFNAVQPIQNLTGQEGTFYRSANTLNESALSWLNKQANTSDQPLFCWIHYMDTHHPYQPPKEYLDSYSFNKQRSRSELGEFTRNAIKSNGAELSNTQLEDVQTAFEACCAYLEDELVSFISTLQNHGHYNPDSDVLVITADHGEILDRDAHQMLGHVPPAFWENIIRVPLIVGQPDWAESTYDEQVSIIDLKPLLMDSVGLGSGEIDSPADLHRNQVMTVSEWEELDDGSITTFRGMRTDAGMKCFGLKCGSNDYVAVTEVANDGCETVQSKYDVPLQDYAKLSNSVEDIVSTLDNHGGPVEYESNFDIENQVDEEHLRDLGYL